MKFVTIQQIATAAGKSPQAVNRALGAAGIKPARTPGVKGLRLDIKAANAFIAKQWPGSTPLGTTKES